jgi:pimeloyl-ACP methyl ester carboxylesterase
MTAPPNERYGVPMRHLSSALASSVGTRYKVPVGPPRAVLEVLIIEPGYYSAVMASQATTRPTGRSTLNVHISFDKRSTTRPVKERGTIFLLHGYTATKEFLLPWALILAQEGYRTVLVDIRGHGRSSGDVFSLGKYETADMVQVLDYLSQRHLCGPNVGVMGWSFGADLALFWGSRDPRVKTVVALAPYDDPQQALSGVAKAFVKLPILPGSLDEGFQLASRKLDVDWADWRGSTALRRYGRPVLLVYGTADTISPEADAGAMNAAVVAGSQQLILQGAEHVGLCFWFHRLRAPVLAWFAEHGPETAAP